MRLLTSSTVQQPSCTGAQKRFAHPVEAPHIVLTNQFHEKITAAPSSSHENV